MKIMGRVMRMVVFWWLIIIQLCCLSININAEYNVVKYGARGDGKTEAAEAFLKAWRAACNSSAAATIRVPKGRFLLNPVTFRGPCNNKITLRINGTIIAPTDYRILGSTNHWILFVKVARLSVFGGTLDAKGTSLWACKNSSATCPTGARSITFNWITNGLISGLTSINSQLSHMVINSCNDTVVRNVKLYAPDNSPNTDGIHVMSSNRVTIRGCTIQTGDDCISIGAGTNTLLMNTIKCGPGHGISIGSLGRAYKENGVQDITLSNAVFMGSDNGVRIKSWARASTSYVKNVVFQNILMTNVKNPIIIDQNYCPSSQACPNQSSGVKISGVVYKNIKGTSRTVQAVTFDCSSSQPCSGVELVDIKLKYINTNVTATASCNNVAGTTTGPILPTSCL